MPFFHPHQPAKPLGCFRQNFPLAQFRRQHAHKKTNKSFENKFVNVVGKSGFSEDAGETWWEEIAWMNWE
jgi:hypothetical protein